MITEQGRESKEGLKENERNGGKIEGNREKNRGFVTEGQHLISAMVQLKDVHAIPE